MPHKTGVRRCVLGALARNCNCRRMNGELSDEFVRVVEL